MIAGDVMDRAAILLNDTAKSIFTYTIQIPYVNVALDELQETMELNNIPMTNELSAVIPITTVMTDIGGTTGPALPIDLIEIQGLYERLTGTVDSFLEMTRAEFLPLISVLTSSLIYWSWIGQTIQFIGANTNRDVKIKYIGARLAAVTLSTTPITMFNSKSFLSYRTAALCAEFMGENPTRALELNNYAVMAMDRLLGINTKGKQAIAARHRPFMAGYKARGY
jgi:hypothetical protein